MRLPSCARFFEGYAGTIGVQLLCALSAYPCLGIGLTASFEAETARHDGAFVPTGGGGVRRSGTPVAGLVGGQVRVEWWARRGVAVGLDGLLGVAMIDVREPWFVPDFTIGAQAGYRLRTDGARGVHLGGRLAKDVGPCISKNCAYEPLGTAARLDLGVVLDEDRFLEVAAGAAVVVTR